MKLNEKTQGQLYGLVFIGLLIATILYGTTYQQYKHFDISDTRGIADVHGYIKMANGNFGVDPPHRYRPLIPWLAGAISSGLENPADMQSATDALSFYIVNFLFVLAAGIFLFYFLINITGSLLLSFIGLILFLGSRHTIIACATPITDSFYLCSIAAFAWLVVTKRVFWLALSIPLMVWSKETMIPLFFLPFVNRDFWKWYYVLGVISAFVSLWALRFLVGELYTEQIAQYESTVVSINRWATNSILVIFFVAWNGIRETGENILTFRWFHSVQTGFFLVLPMAIAGIIIHAKRKQKVIPLPIILILPVSIVYQLVNEAGGRSLFTGFPVIIAFALIAVREVMNRVKFLNV